MNAPRTAFLLLPLLISACGYPGDPLPPALNIPRRVTDLRGVQRGDELILQFTPVLESTEGLILKSLGGVELRAGPHPPGAFNTELWASTAELLPVSETSEALITVETPAQKWEGREIIFGVRTLGPTKRPSAWSNLITLSVVSPLLPPRALQAENHPEGVVLRWTPGNQRPGLAWRVYRHTGEQEEYTLLGRSTEPNWLDRGTIYGTKYSWIVQGVIRTGEQEVESLPSEPASLTPEDIFPPPVPTALRVLSGVNSLEIAWEQTPSSDLDSWQMWRAEGESPLAPYGEPVRVPAFSDRNVQRGKRYKYAVSSLDTSGNQSKPSEAIEATAP